MKRYLKTWGLVRNVRGDVPAELVEEIRKQFWDSKSDQEIVDRFKDSPYPITYSPSPSIPPPPPPRCWMELMTAPVEYGTSARNSDYIAKLNYTRTSLMGSSQKKNPTKREKWELDD